MTWRDSEPQPRPPGASGLGRLEDRYHPLFLLGQGGMGRIEVALEESADDGPERIVALKRLLPESARDPRHKEMFLREARLGALLAHPNVVRAFAFGEILEELFLAMEYVEGEPLSRVLAALRKGGRGLGVGLTCHVLAEVCEGLHAAHELAGADGKPLNVVHRDVSPQNVMVAYDGRIKVLDFGVAKFDNADHKTRTGEVKGKMAYMSPEQALGDTLDRRSDLFSVGAVLFECATGRPMWGTGTDVELMRKLALELPPLLDSAKTNIPPRLASLHARLVARDADVRPGNAREVASELRALAASGEPLDPQAALVAMMTELFGEAAADRRALLAEALSSEAPSRVEALRRTLEPGDVLRQSSVVEPLVVRAPPNPPRKGRRGLILATAVAATIAASAVVGAGARRAPANTPPAFTASPSGMARVEAPQSPEPPPSSVASGAGVPSMDVKPPGAPLARPISNRIAPPPTTSRQPSPPAQHKAPAVSTKAHDVDPAPF